MRVGIITFQRANNLGAVLQCYALNHYLNEKNIESEVIDYRNTWMERNFRVLPEFRKNLIQWIRMLVPALQNYSERKEKFDKFEEFRKKICFSKEYTYSELVNNGLNSYDILISGSDQVWNPVITNGLDRVYFQDFTTTAVKASYAISLGSVSNKEYKEQDFWDKINSFDFISCREQDAVRFLSEKLHDRCVVQCVDPVLLLDADKWIKLVEGVDIKCTEKYILLYSVEHNEELDNIAIDVAKKRGLKVIAIDCKIDNPIVENRGNVGPEEFVKLIFEAESVITSSFHATAFSCIFNKDIYCMLHSLTGMRVISITELFGVRNRVFSSYDDYKNNGNRSICRYDKEKYLAARKISECYIADVCASIRES